MVNAEIITIGNEILSGLTVNTNATWLAQKLLIIGLPVGWITSIADIDSEIESALETAAHRADVIICTGGLGPTPDDLTKRAICKFFNTKLIVHKKTLENIKKIFEGRNLIMTAINRNQAMIPKSAKLIKNYFGTAPGLRFEKKNKLFYFLPGVPMEMKALIEQRILNQLKKKFQFPGIPSLLFRTTGIPESKLFEKLEATLQKNPTLQVAFLPKSTGVDLRISFIKNSKTPSGLIAKLQKEIRENIGKYIYTDREAELPEIIGEILINKKCTIAVAESFTGGLISDWFTDVPGSSAYFLGSVTTYSNESKRQLLNVSSRTLNRWGAVSKKTVIEMVIGVQRLFKSDCAIASTGIAGPTGATDTKPVGLCFLATMFGDKISVKQFSFGKNRRFNKERGATAGLELLRRLILDLK